MSPALALVLLIVGTLVWLGLPFIPAMLELLRPRDAAPLAAVGNDAGDLTFFAEGFRRYLSDNGLADSPTSDTGPFSSITGKSAVVSAATTGSTRRALAPTPSSFALADGTPVRAVHSQAEAEQLSNEQGTPRSGDRAPREIASLVTIEAPVHLASDLAFEREVYAREDIQCGPHNVFRALLAERRAVLGEGSTVLRWVHAEEQLIVSGDSMLYGRATSGDELLLGPSVRFQRLGARRIVVGNTTADIPFDVTAPILVTLPPTNPFTPADAAEMAVNTWRITGNLVIPPNSYVTGQLVVTGSVEIGPESRIDGSIKAHGDLRVHEGCIVAGTLAARRRVDIGERCRVGGPVIAEREVIVGTHAWIGQPMSPTTVTAPVIVLEYGATVFGAVQAREGGWTVAKE